MKARLKLSASLFLRQYSAFILHLSIVPEPHNLTFSNSSLLGLGGLVLTGSKCHYLPLLLAENSP